jgi:carbon monoxide dehydrogenase subunit G
VLIQQRFTVAAPPGTVWAFFLDVPGMAACVPGVEQISALDERTYQGVMRVKVGPLGFRLAGRVLLEQVDEPARAASFALSAEDSRLASAVQATLRLALGEAAEGTAVTLDTEANVLGRLGQFGQGVIKLTADNQMKQFVACVQARLSSPASAQS